MAWDHGCNSITARTTLHSDVRPGISPIAGVVLIMLDPRTRKIKEVYEEFNNVEFVRGTCEHMLITPKTNSAPSCLQLKNGGILQRRLSSNDAHRKFIDAGRRLHALAKLAKVVNYHCNSNHHLTHLNQTGHCGTENHIPAGAHPSHSQDACWPPKQPETHLLAPRTLMSQHSTSSAEVEVLVHISAPGTVRDDATYRSHASACLSFEPVTRIPLTSQADTTAPSSSVRDEGETTFGSFTSSWPCTAEEIQHQAEQLAESDETSTPPSTVPESTCASPGFSDEGQEDAESDRTDTPTFTATPPMTWSGVERNQSPDASPIKPIYISISSETTSSQLQSQSQLSTQEASQPSLSQDQEIQWQEQLRFPMEIHPPHPTPSSTARFKTHLTPALRMLVGHAKLSTRYAPGYQARALRVCERGYWFVRIPLTTSDAVSTAGTGVGNSNGMGGRGGWSVERFMQFWEYLDEYVGSGRAGWGVWCVADMEGDEAVEVRVCTWGEVVGAMYLVLYMASDRAIASLEGVEWRDASEKAVIRM
ncbi:hypothetical protein MGYG_05251 [Nannizzia gypsea CBS 118893]|uniref:NTF2-like domain-containing protein n=1 Tax=Arthroderma gypseum (strain ATCC MYA-4604 / CBS 118893) TaxID=535722 RepID=E4UVC2_ARTGP|nr:hypothetical protein MGYG_05251 [Nannizzia gypsea CBS 118893]EFR02249.1 hypothetical protein MGYG_05251 [Nannizzia gypsea CBS 118893]